MKKMMTLAMMMVMTIAAQAFTYSEAKSEALFLSDKMAYELNLNDAQYNDVYEINLDYLMGVGSHADVLGNAWSLRNTSLRYVLTAYQYDKYLRTSYFYRPLSWTGRTWGFSVRSHYTDRTRFYKSRPQSYLAYKGGSHGTPASRYAHKAPAPKAPVAQAAPSTGRSVSPHAAPSGGGFGAHR